MNYLSPEQHLIKKKIRGDFASVFEADRKIVAPLTKLYTPKSQTTGTSIESSSNIDYLRDSYTIMELLSLEGEIFLETAYRCILKRAPDPSGQKHYQSQLKCGGEPKSIIEALRYSEEGERAGVSIEGIRPRFIYRAITAPLMRLKMLRAKGNT